VPPDVTMEHVSCTKNQTPIDHPIASNFTDSSSSINKLSDKFESLFGVFANLKLQKMLILTLSCVSVRNSTTNQ
jgi:hypothetical protein